MAQRISSEQEEKTGHARALVRCHDDSMAANSRLAESAASSMEEPNMAAFVQVSDSRFLCVAVTSLTRLICLLLLFQSSAEMITK